MLICLVRKKPVLQSPRNVAATAAGKFFVRCYKATNTDSCLGLAKPGKLRLVLNILLCLLIANIKSVTRRVQYARTARDKESHAIIE